MMLYSYVELHSHMCASTPRRVDRLFTSPPKPHIRCRITSNTRDEHGRKTELATTVTVVKELDLD